MTIDNAISVLRDNHIPVEWVDHSYTYGLQYLSKQLTENGKHLGLFKDADNTYSLTWNCMGVLLPSLTGMIGWYP